MKITETHKNGAHIEVNGIFGVQKTLTEWRDRQDNVKREKTAKKPKVIGTGTIFLGADNRTEESYTRGKEIPIVQAKKDFKFGFQLND